MASPVVCLSLAKGRPRRLGRAGPSVVAMLTAMAIPLLPAGSAWSQAQTQAVEVQVDEISEADAPGDALEDILGPDYQPGFSVLRGENIDAVDDALHAFHTHLDSGEWEKAFRQLIDLSESTRHVMVPLEDSPVYVPIHRSIQQRLRGLPPEGRRAFQQFYDAQARERLGQCLAHPQPGSDAQLAQARQAYEYFLLASSGDAIANLLGDLYFERGRFAQAAQCYDALLAYHPTTSLPELGLQYKRILALQRSGQTRQAREIINQLAIRYEGRAVAYGGGDPNALQTLRATLGDESPHTADATPRLVPAALPEPEAQPIWQMTFADERTRTAVEQSGGNRGYYAPADLLRHIPVAAIDDRTLYAQWHGLAFAIDLTTGKLIWRTGRFSEVAASIAYRINTAAGNPRGYKIALTESLVLVQSAPRNNRVNSPNAGFVLRAYDKQDGALTWDTSTLPAWEGYSFCGQPLTVGDAVYVIAHTTGLDNNQNPGRGINAGLVEDEPFRRSTRLLTLYRIDPATGTPAWSVPLGEAEVRAIQYSEFTWMPQPLIVEDGAQLLVLANNGALLCVDTVSQEVAWAVRLLVPDGIEQDDFGQTSSPTNNVQSPGEVVRLGDRVYVKEAWSRRVYVIDTEKAVLLGEDQVPSDTSLVGVDADRLYLMSSSVRAYPADVQGRMLWNNNQISSPGTGSAILTDDALYVLGGNKLHALALGNGDPAQAPFTSRHLRGNGGTLMMAGDKLICITDRDITAFSVPTKPAPTGELP